MTIDVMVAAGQTNTQKYNFTADKVVMFADAQGANTLYCLGTFGGGTLTFYASPDGQDANKVALGITMAAAGLVSIPAFLGPLKTNGILAILTGSTAPNLNVWIL